MNVSPAATAATADETAVADQALPAARSHFTRRSVALYVAAYLGLYIAVMTPLLASLAIQLGRLDPGGKTNDLGLVIGAGTLVGLILGPVVGTLSDATRSRYGRRRPWILTGLPVILAGAVVTGLAPSVFVVGIGYVVSQIGLSLVVSPLTAIFPDQVPEQQRGWVSGLLGFTAQISGVFGFLLAPPLAHSPLLLFLIPALLCVAVVAPAVLLLPDPQPHISGGAGEPAVARPRPADVLRSLRFDPRKHPDFGWVWLGRFLMQSSLMVLSTYQLYFLTDHLHYQLSQVGGLMAMSGGIGLLMTSSGAVLSGMRSDRTGRRKRYIAGAGILLAVGFAVIATASSFGQVMIGSQVILFGAGVFGAVDLAAGTDVLPDRESGGARFMAIFGIAAALPQTLAPLAGSLLLALAGQDSYPLLFLVASGVALLAGVSIRRVRGIR